MAINTHLPKKKVIQAKQVRVDELLELIGMSCIEDIVLELQADKWVAKLKAAIVFKLVVYSLLDTERISLRGMEENFSTPVFKALEQAAVGETAHNSIRDRLVTIDVRVFEKLYGKVRKELAKHFDDRQLSRYNIKRYDSTMIAVFSHMLQGMKVGNTSKKKNQVKITTELQNDFQVGFSFHRDQAHLSEEVALKELIEGATHGKDDLIVFDRGLKSRGTFVEFKEKFKFVTRLHDKNRYKLLRPHHDVGNGHHGTLEFVQDSIVYLYGDGSKLVKEEFRLVEVARKEDGKKVFFLTNILDLPAESVAETYRQRWQIEVFFRFLKQEMNLTHFVSNDVNAIKVMIYCTLITAMLILVYKKKNGITSYKIAKIQFFKELEASIILAVIETPEGLDRFRQNLKKYIQKE